MDGNDNNHVLVHEELPESLVGDKIRLTQVLINLMKMAQVF